MDSYDIKRILIQVLLRHCDFIHAEIGREASRDRGYDKEIDGTANSDETKEISRILSDRTWNDNFIGLNEIFFVCSRQKIIV